MPLSLPSSAPQVSGYLSEVKAASQANSRSGRGQARATLERQTQLPQMGQVLGESKAPWLSTVVPKVQILNI